MKTVEQKKENTLLTVILCGSLVNGACSLAVGSLIPFFRGAYGLSYEGSGMLISMLSAGNMIAILLMGFLPLWVGRRKSVILTAVWMMVAYAMFLSGIGGAALLPFACLLLGISKGGLTNFSNTMISTLPPQKSAVSFNLLHGAYAMGALIVPILLVAFTAHNFGAWKYMAGLLFVMAAATLIAIIFVPLPNENLKKRARDADFGFVKHKNFWLSAVILFFYVSTEYAITGWLVTYFQDIGILSDNASQMMSSLLWLVMFLGRMLGAAISVKVSCRAMLAVDGIGLIGFFVLAFFSHSATPIIIGIIGVGFFMATIYPSATSLGVSSVKGNDIGISAMTLAGSIGGIITPAAVGFVAGKAGIQAGMGVVAITTILLLLTIMLAFFINKPKKN